METKAEAEDVKGDKAGPMRLLLNRDRSQKGG